MDWDQIRRENFPITEHWAYFDHAAVAPLSRPAAEAINAWMENSASHGVVRWLNAYEILEQARDQAARLVHASVDEIAFVQGTTQGIGYVAEGFPWNPGENVVTAAEEYPSNVYPWMNLAAKGVSLRRVEGRDGRIWLEDIEAAIDPMTRLVTISHVEFASGFRNDLDALAATCQHRGVALFVDAIQGLGPLTINLETTPIDFLATGGQKWLLGVEGAGFLFVRKPWIERLRCVVGLGSHSVVDATNYTKIDMTLKPNARRWEGGCYNMAGVHALGASLGMFLKIGPDAISSRVLHLADQVRLRARDTGWGVFGSERREDCSGIVSLTYPGADHEAVVRLGRELGVVVSCRAGRLRVSPHFYNNDSDLDRLTHLFRRVAG